jgi:hypothetical protein
MYPKPEPQADDIPIGAIVHVCPTSSEVKKPGEHCRAGIVQGHAGGDALRVEIHGADVVVGHSSVKYVAHPSGLSILTRKREPLQLYHSMDEHDAWERS